MMMRKKKKAMVYGRVRLSELPSRSLVNDMSLGVVEYAFG
jgi:hypothetical protein